ncbi:MAG: hypothetical protein OJJ54_22510 [Pseudonocardia sp.]|nr:hypothetical protein [Pseudonocardia sp.]
MSRNDFGDVNAHTAQFADQIINTTVEPGVDQCIAGNALLDQRAYDEAMISFASALRTQATDPSLNLSFALALMKGARPSRVSRATLDRVARHLDTASTLPAALVLQELINEDYTSRWRTRQLVPPGVAEAISRIDPTSAERILTHVRVEDSAIWAALASARGWIR